MMNNKQVQRTMFLYRGKRGHYKPWRGFPSLLEETGSSKGSDYSLAELGQSLIA